MGTMRMPQFTEISTLDPNAGFSVGEAARLLGLSHNGVLSRIKSGTLLAGKSGARYYITGSEIQGQIKLPGEIKPETIDKPAADSL